MNIELIEDALISYASEAKRPIAALHSLGARHANNVEIIRVFDSDNGCIVATSLGGVWTSRRWQVILPLADAYVEDLFISGELDHAVVDDTATVITTSGNGVGDTHAYTVSWALAAYYMRGALARLGEVIAASELGDPHTEVDGYYEPVTCGPRRTFSEYFQIGRIRLDERNPIPLSEVESVRGIPQEDTTLPPDEDWENTLVEMEQR